VRRVVMREKEEPRRTAGTEEEESRTYIRILEHQILF
jgi:hypothetical protein